MIAPSYGSIRATLAKKDDQQKKRRTTQPGHVDILLPEERVSPGEVARPAPIEPLSEDDERIRRHPPNLGTLGRGRIFVQKAHEPAEVVEAPAERPAAEPPRRSRWPWIVVLGLAVFGTGGAAAYVYRDQLLPKPPEPKPAPKPEMVVRTELAEIPAAATFFNTGPFDEQRLGEAYFAPDGRRYAFLFREGGEYGFAGAGREKTPNMLELNGRRVHLGSSPEQEAGRRRLGYFEATDRFWYLVRNGDHEQLILEDARGGELDAIGPPVEAPKDKQIGYWARRGDRWFIVVGDWTSAPYDQPLAGPWFSPNGDAFAFLVGAAGDRTRRGLRHVVACSIETKICDKRPNNPLRSIEEYLEIGGEDELFFALDWYATPGESDDNENLEKMVVTKRGGRWQYAVITRASGSMTEVPLGERMVNLAEIAKRSGIERPWLERIVVSSDGSSVAAIVSGRTYVAGDGIVLRQSKDGAVHLTPEYARCKFAARPFAKREWLVMSDDHSKIAFCTHDPAQGERMVVNENKLEPYTYVMSRPVFSPDGDTVAYFAIHERSWWAIAGKRKDGPYDELFGEPRFAADGSHLWYGARRGRTIYFVRMSLSPLAQPADAAVDLP